MLEKEKGARTVLTATVMAPLVNPAGDQPAGSEL
jgi:hypothetical protein